MKFPTYECHTFDEEGCFCVYGRSQTVKQQNQFEVKKHNLKKKKKTRKHNTLQGHFQLEPERMHGNPRGK